MSASEQEGVRASERACASVRGSSSARVCMRKNVCVQEREHVRL